MCRPNRVNTYIRFPIVSLLGEGGMTKVSHSRELLLHMGRLYDEGRREYACRGGNPGEVAEWQARARPRLRELIGLDRIAETNDDHRVRVRLDEGEVVDGYLRQKGWMRSEPEIEISFWMLRPLDGGPHPLGIFPHGHSKYGMNPYAGIARDEEHRLRIETQDRDVAVQAVKRGFVAIAPNTRGFQPASIPDLKDRHGGRDCRAQLMHCLLAGRTPIGERVWDMLNLLDWAEGLRDVDTSHVLVMGNSGGGVVTIYTAACDERVTVAVPSCSFCTYVGANGIIHHCDCNAVPGILRFGGFHDVAGLIAPRDLCIVNGREDTLFPIHEVDRAVRGLSRIYDSAGAKERFVHRYGPGGHRFYSQLMWPFIESAMGKES